MNLSRKLPLAIAMALLFTLAAGFFGLWSAHQSLGVFHGDVQRHMAAERLAAEVEGHFKTQVQEWKNVLLRGSDNALRERHWKGFLSDERAVQDKTTALLALVEDTALREMAQRFVAQHRKMAEGYRVGLDKFEATGFDPPWATWPCAAWTASRPSCCPNSRQASLPRASPWPTMRTAAAGAPRN